LYVYNNFNVCSFNSTTSFSDNMELLCDKQMLDTVNNTTDSNENVTIKPCYVRLERMQLTNFNNQITGMVREKVLKLFYDLL